MKKIIFIFSAIALIACKKDKKNEAQPVTPKYWCEFDTFDALGDTTKLKHNSYCLTQDEIDNKRILCQNGGGCKNFKQLGRCN